MGFVWAACSGKGTEEIIRTSNVRTSNAAEVPPLQPLQAFKFEGERLTNASCRSSQILCTWPSHTSLAVLEGSARVTRNSELLSLYVPSHKPSLSQNERETTLGTNYPDLCIFLWSSWYWSLLQSKPADPIWPFCNYQLLYMFGLQMLYSICSCTRNFPSVFFNFLKFWKKEIFQTFMCSVQSALSMSKSKHLGETELQIWQEKQLPNVRLCPFSPYKQKCGPLQMPCQLISQLYPKSSVVLLSFISFEL